MLKYRLRVRELVDKHHPSPSLDHILEVFILVVAGDHIDLIVLGLEIFDSKRIRFERLNEFLFVQLG